MRKILTADRAVATAMASINAEAKAADRRAVIEGANRFAPGMMDRIRGYIPTIRAIETDRAAERGAAFAASPRGRRLLAARG